MAIKIINDEYLSAIGAAIRSKNGTEETYKPSEMAAAIEAIEGGGDSIPEELLNISGSANYLFANRNWDKFIEQYGDKITTTDITGCKYAFHSAPFTTIPFSINYKKNASPDCERMFYNNKNLTHLPTFTGNPQVLNDTWMFVGCNSLVEIPDSFYKTFDFSYLEEVEKDRSAMFQNCYALRSFPIGMLKHDLQTKTDISIMIYSGLCVDCRSLDRLDNIPVMYKNTGITTNMFYGAFRNMFRLKSFTFETNADGSAIVAKWSGQVIDGKSWYNYGGGADKYLYWGATDNSNISFTRLPAYFTEETRIYNDATYQALKDNEDRWTQDLTYSNFNKNSAIATINSLPDTSAYIKSSKGTVNIISFNGASGSKTDGGAIEDLTNSQIAVAAAKGWTVSLI